MKTQILLASSVLLSTALACEAEPDSFVTQLQPVSACLTECCQTLHSRPAMTYTYYQNTGHFIGGSGAYEINTHGYSGQHEGYMNPAK